MNINYSKIKIGIIDLDTTHARSFSNILTKSDKAVISGVFDRGRIRGNEESLSFSKDYGAELYSNTEELCKHVDAVMVLSVDWMTHAEDIEKVIRAGLPCLCDKPIAGSTEDLKKIKKVLKETGTPFLGGSGWRWNSKVKELSENKRTNMFFVMPPPSRFYHSNHGTELLAGVLGPGFDYVYPIYPELEKNNIIALHHTSNRIGFIIFDAIKPSRKIPYFVDEKVYNLELSIEDIQGGLCNTFLNMIETGLSPARIEDQFLSLKLEFACHKALKQNIKINVNSIDKYDIDSSSFIENYCKEYLAKK